MDPHDEDVLVVGAVEDADPPALGQGLDASPQVIVVELLGEGCLKLVTWQPCGFTPDMTCRIVPSFPAASIAWKITRMACLSFA